MEGLFPCPERTLPDLDDVKCIGGRKKMKKLGVLIVFCLLLSLASCSRRDLYCVVSGCNDFQGNKSSCANNDLLDRLAEEISGFTGTPLSMKCSPLLLKMPVCWFFLEIIRLKEQ